MRLHNLFDCTPSYDVNNELHTLHECFIELKMPEIAEQIISYRGNQRLEEYVRLAQNIAVRQNKTDVIEQLEFAGLVYPSSVRSRSRRS